MNEDRITDLVIKISTELASLNANMTSVLSQLGRHEQRLTELEKSEKNTSLKDDVVRLLVKALIISVITVGSLAGAGTLIAKLVPGT